jgi:hypothetical protein
MGAEPGFAGVSSHHSAVTPVHPVKAHPHHQEATPPCRPGTVPAPAVRRDPALHLGVTVQAAVAIAGLFPDSDGRNEPAKCGGRHRNSNELFLGRLNI